MLKLLIFNYRSHQRDNLKSTVIAIFFLNSMASYLNNAIHRKSTIILVDPYIS